LYYIVSWGRIDYTFFLIDEKEKTQCSLSFERPKESEPKACPEAKPKGKAVVVALSVNYYTTTFVVRLLLFLCLQQQRKSNQKSLPRARLREKPFTLSF